MSFYVALVMAPNGYLLASSRTRITNCVRQKSKSCVGDELMSLLLAFGNVRGPVLLGLRQTWILFPLQYGRMK